MEKIASAYGKLRSMQVKKRRSRDIETRLRFVGSFNETTRIRGEKARWMRAGRGEWPFLATTSPLHPHRQ